VVAVAAGDGLAAAGDGRPTHRENRWELPTGFSSSNTATETLERIVGPLYQLLHDIIKEVLINAAPIVARLCHCSVRTSWVDPSADHVVENVYLSGFNVWRGGTKIRVETTQYICACIIARVINVSFIVLTLCSTCLTKMWWDRKLGCFPARQTLANGCYCEGNECWVDFIDRWSIFYSHLSYAIEVCLVNKIHNFGRCNMNLALINWLSGQRMINKGTLNLPHERLWGM